MQLKIYGNCSGYGCVKVGKKCYNCLLSKTNKCKNSVNVPGFQEVSESESNQQGPISTMDQREKGTRGVPKW